MEASRLRIQKIELNNDWVFLSDLLSLTPTLVQRTRVSDTINLEYSCMNTILVQVFVFEYWSVFVFNTSSVTFNSFIH